MNDVTPTPTDRIPAAFRWLNITQFLGALNDNVFQMLLIFLLVDIHGEPNRARIIAYASVVFVLPFLLFANAAGVLADRAPKSAIIRWLKVAEVLIMAVGCLAVYQRSPSLMFVMLFLMCTHSAFFGPAKYGVIPELVADTQLSRANSSLVGMTYLAIIIGTFLPSFVLDHLKLSHLALGGICLAIALAGNAAALGVSRTTAAGSTRRPSPLFFMDIFRTLRDIRSDRYLFLTVIGSAYFLFLAAFIKQNLLLFGPEHLGITGERSGYFFPIAALGIGVGALAAGAVSGRNIEFGIVPVGAVGLAIACILLGTLPPGVTELSVLMFVVGCSSGLFIVPLNAFIQQRSPPQRRGEILAANSFLSFIGVALSAGLMVLLHESASFSPKTCFLIIGLLTAVLAIAAGRVLPDFLLRFIAVVITRCVYRIRTHGVEHIPTSGPALLVANHVTWADPVLISVLTQRRIRFLMSREIMVANALRPVFKLMNVIPISANDPPRQIVKALQEARAAMDEGYLVCIFSEGALTRNGNLRAFRPGLERIMKGSNYPIIPIYIGGAWGSIFSYYAGKLLATLPRAFPYPIWLAVGAPLPATSSSADVRQAITEISGTTFDIRKEPQRSLGFAFVRTARRFWKQPALSDTTGKRLSFGQTLAGAIAFGRALEPQIRGQDHVGILLPASVGGALTNIAVTLSGRVPVNLNFTASREALAYAIKQSDLRTIVSSRAFIEKLENFSPPSGLLFLEDLLPRISTRNRLSALLAARCAPARWLMCHRRPTPDDLATIIFSSGSTGLPKGVMLTHHNLLSNVEAFASVFGFEHTDRVCAILPLFHSFGFTATLWCPMILGFRAHYHPNPLDSAKITEVVRTERLTVLLTTPTFLLAYIRRAKREDFASLRSVITGAEKLKTRVADAFAEQFGIRPLEGYGSTELSPVVSINLPDYVRGGVAQTGTKPGSTGHPLPGIAVRITDPETGATLPIGADGLVRVKGPNVMRGYLNDPARTAEALHDGWYNTGDIGHIDEDGFIFLVDRLARFSKIGGEMVPHVGVEEKIMAGLDATQASIAVTAAPDERKGEQLVVIFTAAAGDAASLQRLVKESDLPNLWKPREGNFVRVDALPVLGTGKLDLRKLKEIARAHVEGRAEKN